MSEITEAIICLPKPGAKAWPKGALSKKEANSLKPRQQCLVFPYDSKTNKYAAPTKVEPKPIVKEGEDNGVAIGNEKKDVKYYVEDNIPKAPHWVRIGTRSQFTTPLSGDPINRINLFYEITPEADVKATKTEGEQGGIVTVSSKSIMGIEILDAKKEINNDKDSGSPINVIEQEALAIELGLLFATPGVKDEWKNAINTYLTSLSSNTVAPNSEPPLLK